GHLIMNLEPLRAQTHPLDLPEIRTRIAYFMCNSDRISCMRVNKTWFQDFAGSLWHTVDLYKYKAFSQVPPTTIAKYGRLIRKARGMSEEKHFTAFQHAEVNLLTELHVSFTHSLVGRALFFDVFRRNRFSLTTLLLFIWPEMDREKRESCVYFINIDIPASGSKLTDLHLSSLNLSRSNFSDILKYSPRLQTVNIFNILFLVHNPTSELFQHQGVKTLHASVCQVLAPDDHQPKSPSLLRHFPQLETWADLAIPLSNPAIRVQSLRDELACCCPRLSNVDFQGCFESCEVGDFLFGAFVRLKSCILMYDDLDATSLIGILNHQETITRVELKELYFGDRLYHTDDNPAAKNALSLILRSCRVLEVLSAWSHRMDMDVAEEHEWVCDGLKELRVRVLGLETYTAVDDCLERLRMLRSCFGQDDDMVLYNRGGSSLDRRICRKLLPMKKLKTVWLGTKNFYLATL
ncbi:hypothetical protein BGZ96_005257, partial [Linnemannia gamsii]